MRGEDVQRPPLIRRDPRSNMTACVGSYRLDTGGRILLRNARGVLQTRAIGADAVLALGGISLDASARDSLAALWTMVQEAQ